MPPDRADGTGPQATNPDRRVLAEFAVSHGEAVPAAGNRPVRFDDPESLWFVERGALDVFLIWVRDGMAEAPFRHVLRLEAGRLAFGAPDAEELRLLAKGVPDTILRRIPAERVFAGTQAGVDGIHGVLAEDADDWIAGIASAIAAQIEVHPRPDMQLGEGAGAEARGVLTSAGGVVWVKGGAAQFFGTEEPEADDLVPLTRDNWATLRDPAVVDVLSSRALGAETLLSRALPGFHRLAFGAEVINRRMLLADQVNLQVARSAWRRHDEDEARRRLFGFLGSSQPEASAGGQLIAALRAVGQHEGVAIRTPGGPADEPPDLPELLHASGVRARQVRLSPEDRWWRADSGAMLAFRNEGGTPLALVPGTMGR